MGRGTNDGEGELGQHFLETKDQPFDRSWSFFVGHDAKSKAMSLVWACLEMMINQWTWESNQYQTNLLGLDLFRELSFSALIF